jgi:hypothetical protein
LAALTRAVPGTRADRADIGHGQHQKQTQALHGLHQPGEGLDRPGVVQVALEGSIAHGQVVQHQPGDGLGLLPAEAQARAEPLGNLGALLRVVAGPALGDVVQQQGEVEHLAGQHLVHHLGRNRRLFAQPAPLDLVQDADREDRVLVDREVVVHIVLHLRHHAAEVGHEAAEYARLVEPPQSDFGILGRDQDVQEDLVRRRVLAQGLVDVGEGLGALDVEPVALDTEAGDAAPAGQRAQAKARRPLVVGFEGRAKDTGQIADILGGQEIVLHQALDVAGSGMGLVAHARGDLHLQVESEPLLGAAGQVMQVAAQGPEIVVRFLEALGLAPGEDTALDQA